MQTNVAILRTGILTLLLCFPAGLFAQATGAVTGTVTTKKAKEVVNVVVYVDGVQGDFKPPSEPSRVDQKNLTFTPHVLPVVKGTTVSFVNSDDVLHNVFSPDECAEKMNLGTWPKGESKTFTFKQAGCHSALLCKVHPEMEGWVVVLDNPFFAKPDSSGKYTIPNVPAGKYTIKTWHQKYSEKSAPVEVKAGGSTTVDLDL
ncbi:MAG: carboxypeptidase regulatory-like domain-containing protein [Candidatus Wallbacteria bacterium]|nr:carboxypeptidase regulatory-like domain-containing protein [Candidatus Wallbacteria bacterium]